MGSTSVEDVFVRLQDLTDQATPPPQEVKETLNTLADAVLYWGDPVRSTLIGLGAYERVVKAWALICYSGVTTAKVPSPDTNEVREASLKALYSLTPGYPEIIDEIGWVMIRQAIDSRLPESTLTYALHVILNLCVKCEANRERISWGYETMLDPLLHLIRRENPSAEFVRAWCGAVKALLLTDDVRVAYNRAPERRRFIHTHNILPLITGHLYTFEKDEETLIAIVVVLGSMAVNTNTSVAIESGNVFPAICNILKDYSANPVLIKNTLSLLRYLNVEDSVRVKCNNYRLMHWVLQLLNAYKMYEDVLPIGMGCVAFMTLRNACQTAQFLNSNGLSIIMDLMHQGGENVELQKAGCLTLRNVSANGGEKARSAILDMGGEDFLRQLQKDFPNLWEKFVKPAIKELGVLKPEDEPQSQGASGGTGSGYTPASTAKTHEDDEDGDEDD